MRPATSSWQRRRPGASAQRKLLYYRNPMGWPTIADAEEGPDGNGLRSRLRRTRTSARIRPAPNQIRISTRKIQTARRSRRAAAHAPARKIGPRARARRADERRVFAISPSSRATSERLHVNVTGQPVAKGQPLFEVYSPELVSAQREYAIACKACRP
jgi:Cu(I)/Ag(I) efflux system membrane fusion protein